MVTVGSIGRTKPRQPRPTMLNVKFVSVVRSGYYGVNS